VHDPLRTDHAATVEVTGAEPIAPSAAVQPGFVPREPGFYLPDPAGPDDGGRLRAKRALADAVRDLVADLAELDGVAADDAGLAAATEALAGVHRTLAGLPSLRGRPRSDWPAEEGAMREQGPLVGRANPAAPPLHMTADGTGVQGWAIYGPTYEGGPGYVHGGVLAATFNDVLGAAQTSGGVAGPVGTLTVRFRSSTPLGRRITYRGRVDGIEGRKILVSGESYDGETLLAQAEAIFVAKAAPQPG
jgi:hypothetical protein